MPIDSFLLTSRFCGSLRIGVARGGRGAMPPKFLESIVILSFKRSFCKQNSVIRLKSSILLPKNFLAPPKFLG